MSGKNPTACTVTANYSAANLWPACRSRESAICKLSWTQTVAQKPSCAAEPSSAWTLPSKRLKKLFTKIRHYEFYVNVFETYDGGPDGLDSKTYVGGQPGVHGTRSGEHFAYRRPFTAEARESLTGEEDSSDALQLVDQLADVIRRKEEHAAAIEAQAQALAGRAFDELNLARTQLRSAEIARDTAEARLGEASAKIETFEGALERIEARISTAETQLSASVLRVKTAETRAAEAEKALRQLEDAIRTQLLRAREQASNPHAAAA